MFFFLSPLAEVALPLDDYSFIDHLWRDWSPGYDGAWDVARVKESIGDPERIVAAIGYYRAMCDPALQVPELADEQAAALLPTPKPTLYLHGRDDDCMLLSSMGSPLDFMAEGSALEIVDDAGHFLHVERPDVVNRRILELPDRLTAVALPPSAQAGGRDPSPPDQPANPSATSAAATRSARARVVGPAARRRQAARPHAAVAQRVEQAPPALAVRSGEGALRPRRRARPARDRRRCAAPWRRQAHWRRSGQRSQSGRAAVQTVAPEVEHGLVELPRLRRRARAGRRAPWPGARVSGAPATARARTRTPLVSTAATSSPKAKARTARAV